MRPLARFVVRSPRPQATDSRRDVDCYRLKENERSEASELHASAEQHTLVFSLVWRRRTTGVDGGMDDGRAHGQISFRRRTWSSTAQGVKMR